ncbi:hypothetical protein V7S43_019081 [Phytophthora oleae]|uniref:Uncharacterized protein n=1 Tax=Phytophthora oleae TaxID=2107226 RepID=A0ABD3F6G2_9STRA
MPTQIAVAAIWRGQQKRSVLETSYTDEQGNSGGNTGCLMNLTESGMPRAHPRKHVHPGSATPKRRFLCSPRSGAPMLRAFSRSFDLQARNVIMMIPSTTHFTLARPLQTPAID